MIARVLRGIVTLVGVLAGWSLGVVMLGFNFLGGGELGRFMPFWGHLILVLTCAAVGGAVAFLLAPPLFREVYRAAGALEQRLSATPIADLVAGALGLLVGLAVAFMLSFLANDLPVFWLSVVVKLSIYMLLGMLGMRLAVRRRSELMDYFAALRRREQERAAQAEGQKPPADKVLDTSAIIDGRIFDVVRADFVDGRLSVPDFVLQELRHIADSPDPLRRQRGRRGLEMLENIRQELPARVHVVRRERRTGEEVDAALCRIAREEGGCVVTTDYNLNKMAGVQGVRVLNVNELAGAMRQRLLPGEQFTVQILREGREKEQGLAYLDDGTMIVIEGGRPYIGMRRQVEVTSLLQTAAGQMVFVKLV
ncbi:Uncharacterized PIN and TRAM-domain containing protein TTHA0540 precursor [uncultured Clostridium sp.]|nr:Uncharacterized PIN and TRAM-domain containing protein TTHA0540 precursor [uncultured Clostridium sp.]